MDKITKVYVYHIANSPTLQAKQSYIYSPKSMYIL